MSSLLGKIKDGMFWLDQINKDRLEKMDGHFFNKAQNIFRAVQALLEGEAHNSVFSPLVDYDAVDFESLDRRMKDASYSNESLGDQLET